MTEEAKTPPKPPSSPFQSHFDPEEIATRGRMLIAAGDTVKAYQNAYRCRIDHERTLNARYHHAYVRDERKRLRDALDSGWMDHEFYNGEMQVLRGRSPSGEQGTHTSHLWSKEEWEERQAINAELDEAGKKMFKAMRSVTPDRGVNWAYIQWHMESYLRDDALQTQPEEPLFTPPPAKAFPSLPPTRRNSK